MKRQHQIILLLACAVLLTTCLSTPVYQNQKAISTDGWHFTDSVMFNVEIRDTLSLHRMYLDIRNTTDYSYSNLFIFMDIEFPDGRILRDTLECILADRRGQWTGKGFGALRFNRFLFRDDVWFPVKGTYSFRITHGMRDEWLAGISDAGIRIEKK